jgi:hypothetical protein
VSAFDNWKRRSHTSPASVSWRAFVADLRARLTPAEQAFLDRSVTKMTPNQRERIMGLNLADAVALLRREMGGPQ